MADKPESSDRIGGGSSDDVLTSSRRPRSPARYSDKSPEHRGSHRSSQPSSSSHRRKSRDRNKHDSQRPHTEASSGPGQTPDLIPRFREQQARESEAEHRSSSRRSHSRDRERHGTPSSYKRHRSRSYSPSSHRKRSRRDGSSSRHNRDRAGHSDSKSRRQRSPHHGESSSHRHSRSYKSSGRSERPRSRSRTRYHKESALAPHDLSRRSRRDSKDRVHSQRDRRSRSRSRSPEKGSESTARHRSRDRSDRGYTQPRLDEGATRATSRSDPDDDKSSKDGQHRSRGASSPPRQRQSHINQDNQKSNGHYNDENKDRDRPNANPPRAPSPSKTTPAPDRNDTHGGFRGVPITSRGSYRGGDHYNGQRNSPTRGFNGSTEPMDLDNRPPATPKPDPPKNAPSGPANSKFSFSFKPTSKPASTPPKPEISQRFNALPQRRDDQSSPRPPHDAPTQPASHKQDHTRPPERPRMAPRMRKVKKIMKKLKPRPTLPTDLANANSVFHRKPGNESVVGSGTYGKVFKALNVYTKDQVALKRIRMEGEKDGFPVTAIREIKLLQSLRHVNIVNLQEVMVERNDCFMVFEYLSHDLTGILNHPSFKLEPPQKKDLARQLFEGLDYLHVRGVLHRDIKAANILVSKEGILKIADFGLARFYAKRHQLEYTNRVITIWYRSPELLLGETKYTAAVDVWSAACVMMEIFTGSATFPGDGTEISQLEKIYNILGTPNRHEWPGLVDLAWFELLRPTVKKKSIFTEKFKEPLTPAAFELMASMFQYDPEKRPTASQILQHAYFTTEEPPAKQATELATIGEWHEFESKALRKEKERKEREAARKAAAAAKNGTLPTENKAAPDAVGQETGNVQKDTAMAV